MSPRKTRTESSDHTTRQILWSVVVAVGLSLAAFSHAVKPSRYFSKSEYPLLKALPQVSSQEIIRGVASQQYSPIKSED